MQTSYQHRGRSAELAKFGGDELGFFVIEGRGVADTGQRDRSGIRKV
ncbi:hypothetical protein [Nocardia sp. NBC_01388]